MSMVTLVEQASAPATPTTGKVRVYVNSGGTLASVDDAGVVTTYGAGITQEQVEDYVGALLQDSSTVDVTYNDAGNAVTFDVIAGGVNHNALLNYVANQHVDHSTVSISAGTGLTGGGDLTASRTISMPSVGTAGTYKSVTTDAQGRVTAGTNPTTLAGYGITDAQPLDSDLTAVAGLASTGLVTRTGTGTATTRTVTASTGITVTNGDGVSGNPTVAITNSGVTAATYQSPTTITSFVVNAQGQITGTTNNFIAIPSTQVTDFNEAAQDAVGGILVDSSSVDFTYNDGGNSIQAFVIPGGVDHNGLANLTTGNPHTQYLLSSTAATTYQPLDSDLTAVAGLAGTGLVTRTGSGTATTRTITAGTYMSVANGDGVSGNPTITHGNSAAVAGTYGSATQVAQVTVGATGHVDAVTNVSIALTSAAVSDFTEAAQDAVGAALTDSSSIDFTYNDAGNTITAAVIPGGVNHNSLLNGGGNTHIDHSTVSIVAGTYMSGGGDITASRTLNHANSAVTPATYGGVNAIPVLGIGATGHVDSASTVNPTAALLTGLAAGTDTPILATNTLLVALANLQAQVDALLATDNEWIELNTASTYTNTSSTTGVNVTELALSITNGRKYYYEATLLYQSAATGTGLAVTITSPDGGSAPGAVMVNMQIAADGTAAGYMGTINSLGDYVTSTGVQTANVPYVCHIKGNFPANATGTFNITFRSEVNGSQVTILPGSTLLVREFV